MTMPYRPLVSVVIPSHNAARYLPESVGSVLDQTYDRVECLVVDDGSTDDTADVARRMADGDERVRYLGKENGGVASARNHGVRRARGELVQFLDSDDWLAPDKLERQVSFIRERLIEEDDFVLYSDYAIVSLGADGQEVGRRIHRWGERTKEGLKDSLVSREFGLDTPTPLHVASALLSRSAADGLAFREDMQVYEDFDYFTRLLDGDVGVYYTPIVGFYYRDDGRGISKNLHDLRVGYLQFLEAVHEVDGDRVRKSPNLGRLLEYFGKRGDRARFDRAMALVHASRAPVYTRARRNVRRRAVFLEHLRMYYPVVRVAHHSRRAYRRVLDRARRVADRIGIGRA